MTTRHRRRKNFFPLVVMSCATIGAVGISEAFFRWLDPKGISYQVEGAAYLIELAVAVNAHPLVYRQGVPGKEIGRYKLNNFGFRGPDFTIEKRPATYRILAIGDSITAGLGVDYEDTWPAHLQARLNATKGETRFEVYNLGIGGYNTIGALGLLLSTGLGLKPDAVILLLVTNDDTIQPGNQEFYRLFPSYADGHVENLGRSQSYARDSWIYPVWRLANRLTPYQANFFYTYALGRNRVRRSPDFDARNVDSSRFTEELTVGQLDMRNAFDQFLKTTESEGIEVLPMLLARRDSAWRGTRILQEVAESHELKLVILEQAMALGPSYRNSPSDGHYNAEGNKRLLAEMLPHVTSAFLQ